MISILIFTWLVQRKCKFCMNYEYRNLFLNQTFFFVYVSKLEIYKDYYKIENNEAKNTQYITANFSVVM